MSTDSITKDFVVKDEDAYLRLLDEVNNHDCSTWTNKLTKGRTIMNNIQINNNTTVIGNRVWINGEELPPAPIKGNSYITTQIDGKVYINGYEFKNGKWRRTLRALWHMWF